MMETGFPVRFPNLKIAFTEGGIAWVPSIMRSMDKDYAERQRQGPYLTDQSSAYFKRVFFATQPMEEPENLKSLASLIPLFAGENSVMFASDWPHHDFDHPSTVVQNPLADDVQWNIMGGNELRLLSLEERVP